MPPPPPPPPPGFAVSPSSGQPPVPPGYGADAAATVRSHPAATSVMVWSIVALAVGLFAGLGLLASPFIWARARSIRTEMNAEPDVFWSNRGSVTTSIVCSAIGTLLIPIALLMVGVYVMIGGRFG